MYYPYLRGKQYELLALRDLLMERKLSKKIIPIIEPVKETASFKKTVDYFLNKNHTLYTIVNPKVGEYSIYDSTHPIHGERCSFENDALLIDNTSNNFFYDFSKFKKFQNLIVIYNDFDSINYGKKFLYDNSLISKLNFVPDGSRFLRQFKQEPVGIIRDAFAKKDRNVDYLDTPEEFFSDDHLYYQEQYEAFSDYSITGKSYIDGGFAPIAVAIHIVFFDENDVLRIRHFVSDTNEDITDPAGKFNEALSKLIEWAETIDEKNESISLEQFRKLSNEKRYPGLGFVKKLCIMHHLEIMGNFLDNRGS
ncbi:MULTISPECIES: sce7725 family protein [Enterococcus]|uniref:sce7725 family protein n=1 Tax=Enterococcus TaxID=1350 RepID=UPI002891ABCC|nr:sce7725 family protein [Enterococcus thailandicus]MDT2752015.1 sce7725 family protein [Enterococcus thailandicus]MDT2777107.1 sce7725 family protein [Enterococcus thailandicus]